MRHAEYFASIHGLSISDRVPVDPDGIDQVPSTRRIAATDAQVVVLVLRGTLAADCLAAARKTGLAVPSYTMSYLSADSLARDGADARPRQVEVAQSTPNPLVPTSIIAREYQAALRDHAPRRTLPSAESLSGCIAAKVAIEALRRAGGSDSPVRVNTALWALRTNIGDYPIDLTGSNVGTRYVGIAWLDADGRLRY